MATANLQLCHVVQHRGGNSLHGSFGQKSRRRRWFLHVEASFLHGGELDAWWQLGGPPGLTVILLDRRNVTLHFEGNVVSGLSLV